MMNKILLTTIIIYTGLYASALTPQSVSSQANMRGKEYVNPIIHADYSDPDVVASADGNAFYMTASSFQSVPGLPILKSTDLVNWAIVNYALPAVPPKDFYGAAPQHGKGVWAPCIRVNNGKYYIYWGDPDFGIFMICTDNPEGNWSEPVLVVAGKGMIDPSPLWDTDGKAYLANGWAASRCGFNSVITLWDMSADGTKVIGTPRIIYDGNDGVNHTVEGPKLYRHGDYYYMFAPAGGVESGWQLVMRSRDINGPYESKIVMAQGKSDINGPHQGAWVTDAAGSDWFLHFQDKGPYGRIIHLNPMKWADQWPMIGTDADGDGCGDPVRRWKKPAVAKTAGGLPALPLEHSSNPSALYQWHANYKPEYGFPLPEGLMRIYGHISDTEDINLWEVPNLWLQKFPAEKFSVTAKVRISAKSSSEGVSSGIVVMGRDYARLGLIKCGDTFMLQFVTDAGADTGGKETVRELGEIRPTRVYAAGLKPNLECDIWLRVTIGSAGKCDFAYSRDGRKFTDAGSFTARVGKWIGAKTGFYSVTPAGISDRGWIDIISADLKID